MFGFGKKDPMIRKGTLFLNGMTLEQEKDLVTKINKIARAVPEITVDQHTKKVERTIVIFGIKKSDFDRLAEMSCVTKTIEIRTQSLPMKIAVIVLSGIHKALEKMVE